ncbi:putative RNA recognition motif domain, ataxin-2, RNA-binding domain superfamily [Dioscorea sansibarensis]
MAVVAESAIRSDDQLSGTGAGRDQEFQSDVKKLVDLLSKLNPSAKEFVPSSRAGVLAADGRQAGGHRLSADAPVFVSSAEYYGNGGSGGDGSIKDSSSDGSSGNQNNQQQRRRRNGYNQGRRRMSERARRAQKEESIRRTVYVSDIDQHVTEEHLAELFSYCGKVVDCRVCGDTNSLLRFAFIEFADDYGARAALTLGGTMLGFYPVRVLPSKTAILPVNPTFLPKSDDEKEMVTRTVYCTNIDKKVTQMDVKIFFNKYCGEVSRLRLLGDHVHKTRIAFVEFSQAESAIIALSCSGLFIGDLPVRVSPSKTPVRPRVTRQEFAN